MRVATLAMLAGAALAAATCSASPQATSVVEFVTLPGSFRVDETDAGHEISVLNAEGAETTRIGLGSCRPRPADSVSGSPDGIFAPVFPGASAPVIVAVCHQVEGGRRLSVFTPAGGGGSAVFVSRSGTLGYAIWPDRLEVTTDEATAPAVWMPGARSDPELLETVGGNAALAAGRRIAVPPPPDDPEVRALIARVEAIAAARDAEALIALAAPDIVTSFGGAGTLDELRALVSEPRFWDDFGSVVAGGAVVSDDWTDGRRVLLPAAFETWPADLDPYEFLYSDRPGALLRAGPSEGAPVLAPIHEAILAEVPNFEGWNGLYEAGWAYLCAAPLGCGFARRSEVRSPIDWRAVFLQAAPSAPWVLETFVAGD